MISNNELLNLTSKSAIVTGAAKGIGYAIAYRLAEAGAKVLVSDVDGEGAVLASKQINEKGFISEAIEVDVSDESQIITMANTCKEKFGSLDILVNNAGIFPSVPISEMETSLFEKIVDVNLKSVFLSTKHCAEHMINAGNGGRIINITSIDAVHPSMVGLAAYDSSKHGVWGFTKNAALEYAPHNIWVNAIAPGGIYTPGVQEMQAVSSGNQAESPSNDAIEQFLSTIPMHRMGDPDEIAKAVLFLASEMSSYMTGEQIVVDGGALIK